MNLPTSVWLFQSLHALGMALWLSIAVRNNWRGFAGSAFAVGGTMSMAPLRVDPAIDTPLLTRAIRSVALHRAALGVVLALQLAAALAFWAGSAMLVVGGDLSAARPWLNLGLAGFAAFLFAMHLGGLWFGYWIRQEGLQLTHLVLLLWVLAAFFLFNQSWH
ncbi:hypothetical protein CKY39_09380 [Variovorax boronicumulans]|uniref:DUF2165 domain-containing protein n=1 Tax=Variovorax boronicumulans TaxID=436515 RepID=A0A250DG90_9BURK|nr:DUF2165 family protein [Variovorax boronicumulans]ATA53405.1 hypothetical protein CKY39_09380 [Variovorax boronicumulans]